MHAQGTGKVDFSGFCHTQCWFGSFKLQFPVYLESPGGVGEAAAGEQGRVKGLPSPGLGKGQGHSGVCHRTGGIRGGCHEAQTSLMDPELSRTRVCFGEVFP